MVVLYAAGVAVGAASQPATRVLLLVYGAGLLFVIGLILLVGYTVDRRAGYVR
ncbi:MAG TPA: hypothetical protein VLW53_01760 [Candidatus Eisenbacteria bacterium]|nr:hypothetical protein [Candidatus Eisenbacteria bacterium]